MSFERNLAAMSREEIATLLQDHHALLQTLDALRTEHDSLLHQHQELRLSHDELARQVEWFKRQIFGSKSERRIFAPNSEQLTLGDLLRAETASAPAPEIQVPAHRRRSRSESSAEEPPQDLRFDPSVPVEEILVPNPEVTDANRSEFVEVGEKVTLRLAQRPGSYVVLRQVRKVYKRIIGGEFSCPPAPPSVLEKSYADVSLLAGVLLDKFAYHLPLYRQHQRMRACGVKLGRATLTNYVHRTAELLEPIYVAQLESILSSQVLAMDETPIKAGHKKRPPPQRGTMQTAYFWPIYGDKDEVAFPFANTRSGEVVRTALRSYVGVLLTDGYKVYDRYVATVNSVVHAQCWSHTRRQILEAEASQPDLVRDALELIAEIYDREAEAPDAEQHPEERLAHRAEHVRPLVDRFFNQLREAGTKHLLLPTDPFTKAAAYAVKREKALKVFLEYPDVPLDTNHLERAIRPIAMGRRSWLFCWTEVGAKYVGIVQSLLTTCRLHGVDPYTYLVDVLQRIDTHPAKDVALLTPRLWKEHFATRPLRAALDRQPAQVQSAFEGDSVG